MLTALTGCGASDERARSGDNPKPTRVANTRGGAVVLSRDERIAVVANRSAGVVSVFRLDPDNPAALTQGDPTEIDLGEGSEPWASVIGVDDDTAFVVSRANQRVHRLLELHQNPHLDPEEPAEVGSEPTAIAIAPSGGHVFVANWGEGTISVISSYDLARTDKIDLNVALAESGVLGAVVPRPALAHPRALAITDNGDDEDGDETLYATEFFSQPLPTGADVGPELSRQGMVYPIRLSEKGQVRAPISIAPVRNTGFYDAPNSKLPPEQRVGTSCFPNQLYAAAVLGNRLLVTSMCASPVGPLGPATNDDGSPNPSNFKTVVHPALFEIDIASNEELPERRVVLTRQLEDLYEEDNAVDARMPLIPNDIAFGAPGDVPSRACITALGADAVYCVSSDDSGLFEIGSPEARFLDLHGDGPLRPRLPVGIALSQRSGTPFGVVVNDTSQTLSVLDLGSNSVSAAVPTAPTIEHAKATLASEANRGRALFATGRHVWSFKGQAWNSCEGCHPDGLSDGVTWFFSRGPRRTISTAGTYDTEGRRRVMLWTGNIDEVHDVEVIVRSVAGGVGAMLWTYPDDPPTNDYRLIYDGSKLPAGQVLNPKSTPTLLNNLNGSLAQLVKNRSQTCADVECDSTPITDWNSIDAFMKVVRTPRAPSGFEQPVLTAGKTLFEQGGCGFCHGGSGFTLSKLFYTPNALNNGVLPYTKSEISAPQALGLLRISWYKLPPGLVGLNPPAAATGTASFRRWEPGTALAADYAYDAATHAADQINCVLRGVGTFPGVPPPETVPLPSIVPAGVNPIPEVRQDMKTPGLGASGFNIPSLVGLATGAPYFHAGNARTLEELFDPVFAAHYAAVNPSLLAPDEVDRADQVRALVAYLLSIDDATPAPPVVAGTDFCAQAAPTIH